MSSNVLLTLLFMILSSLSSTLFPYTTLFRSDERRRRFECLFTASRGRCAGVELAPWRQVFSCAAVQMGHDRANGQGTGLRLGRDRKSTRLNSSHLVISYAVFCLKKKKKTDQR